jgi:hypothetical protein
MKFSKCIGILFFTAILAAGCAVMNTFLNQDDINSAANGSSSSDGGGNSSADTTPPQVAITSPTNNEKLSKSFTISGTCSDNAWVSKVTIYYYTNGGATNNIQAALLTSTSFSTNIASALLAYAPYRIYAEAKDAAGNKGQTAPVNLIIADIPTVSFIAPVLNNGFWLTNQASLPIGINYSCGGYTVTNVTVINFAAGSAITNIQSSSPNNNSGSWTPTVTLTSNATNIILVYAVSINGDVSSLGSNTVFADTEKPAASIRMLTNLAGLASTNLNIFNIPVSFSDSGSGISNKFYKINSGSEQTFSGTGIPANFADNSTNTISYWVTDKAGNYSITNSLSIIIDKIPPVINVTYYDTVAVIGVDWNSTIEVSDNIGTYFILIESTGFFYGETNISSTLSNSILYNGNSGPDTVNITLFDYAGNSALTNLNITGSYYWNYPEELWK